MNMLRRVHKESRLLGEVGYACFLPKLDQVKSKESVGGELYRPVDEICRWLVLQTHPEIYYLP